MVSPKKVYDLLITGAKQRLIRPLNRMFPIRTGTLEEFLAKAQKATEVVTQPEMVLKYYPSVAEFATYWCKGSVKLVSENAEGTPIVFRKNSRWPDSGYCVMYTIPEETRFQTEIDSMAHKMHDDVSAALPNAQVRMKPTQEYLSFGWSRFFQSLTKYFALLRPLR